MRGPETDYPHMQQIQATTRPAAGLNALLCLAFSGVGIWTLWLLPVFVLPRHPAAAWSLVLVVLLTTTWWSLIHEAIHGLLFPERPLNNAAGRLLCILFGLPFQPVAFGHLFHHRRNRSELDRSEIYERGRPWLPAALSYYFRLLGGLFLGEFALSLLAWLPRRRLTAWTGSRFSKAGLATEAKLLQTTVLTPATLRSIRLDSACILIALGSSFWLYGSDGWMLLSVLLGRSLLISLMDNAYHYATPLTELRYALNLRLPRFLSALILNFNLHRVHHQHPATPWNHLSALFDGAQDRYDGGYLQLTLRQLSGLIPLDP
jgi:fatty acid desaturase